MHASANKGADHQGISPIPAAVNVIDTQHLDHDLIHTGMNVSLQTFQGSRSNRLKTMVVGYERNRYVIIKTPRCNGEPIPYLTLGTIILRFQVQGCVFGFRTSVVRSIGRPFFLTLLRYPDKVERLTLRGSPRIRVVIGIEREGGTPSDELLVDLSGTGASLHLATPVNVSETFGISFTLPTGKRIERMRCTVRRLDHQGSRISVGVSFDKANDDRLSILEYVNLAILSLRDRSAVD